MDASRRQFQLTSAKIPKVSVFPPAHTADESGLLGWGGVLDKQSLIDAYSHGIFPWPHEGYPLLWFSPQERGILDFSDFHISQSLRKARRKLDVEFTLDTAFEEVMRACSTAPRKGQKGTWITDEMVCAYSELHTAGYAHSLEARRSGQLIGGIYGVYVSNYFSAESMFGLEPNISKFCLWELVETLKRSGLTWMDIQMLTPVTESFGGHLTSREEFLKRLGIRP